MSSAVNLEPCAPSCGSGRRRRGFCVRHYTQHLASGAIPRVLHKDYLEGFWARVEKGSGDECWKWNGPVNRDGYGRINYKYKNKLAHQLSFFIHNGHWPVNQALHHCDNPPCTNPKHLYDGTQKDNSRDITLRGRWCPAHLRKRPQYLFDRHRRTRAINDESLLTPKQLAAITEGIAKGWMVSAIVMRYNVTDRLVNRLRKNMHLDTKRTHFSPADA